jgi:rhodanese-related sulfurtransferase
MHLQDTPTPNPSHPHTSTHEDRDAGRGTAARHGGGHPSVEDLVRSARSRLDRLTPRAAAREQADGALLVDLRSEGRRRTDGEVPGSLVLERSVLEWRLDPCSKWRLEEAVDHELRVILFCPVGQMSSLAAGALHDLGLHRSTDIVGGFAAWRAAGLPVAWGVTPVGSYVGSPAPSIGLDVGGQRLLVDGEPVPLTRLEFRVMGELLRAGGRVVSRQELRASIGDWRGSRSRSVDLHVHRIRRKLPPAAADLLTTEWGIGFRLRTGRGD